MTKWHSEEPKKSTEPDLMRKPGCASLPLFVIGIPMRSGRGSDRHGTQRTIFWPLDNINTTCGIGSLGFHLVSLCRELIPLHYSAKHKVWIVSRFYAWPGEMGESKNGMSCTCYVHLGGGFRNLKHTQKYKNQTMLNWWLLYYKSETHYFIYV